MHGAWRRTPQRGDVVVWLAGAVLAGAILGTALTVLRPIADPGQVATVRMQDRAVRSTGTSADTVAPVRTVAPADGAAAGRSADRSGGPSGQATRWGPSPTYTAWVAEPWRTRDLELSELRTVTRSPSGRVEITVDRLTFYSGKEARAYYARHPELEASDYAVVNQNPRIYSFRLASPAPIFLGSTLGTSAVPVRADADFLLGGFDRARQRGTPCYVWLRHDGRDGGWVTYLAEQYLP